MCFSNAESYRRDPIIEHGSVNKKFHKLFFGIMKMSLLDYYHVLMLFIISVPMTYAESIFGQVFIKDEDDAEYTRGELHFVPKYTLYSWNG